MESLLLVVGVAAVVAFLLWLTERRRGYGVGGINEDKARQLVRDAVEWAEDRFPPPEERYPNTPDAPEAEWYAYASTAAIEAAILGLVGHGVLEEDDWQAFTEKVGDVLHESHPAGKQYLWMCAAQVAEYMGRTDDPDIPFFLGMWLWSNVIGEKPTKVQSRDVHKLGRLLLFSFRDWYESGVRYVVVGDDGSALVID